MTAGPDGFRSLATTTEAVATRVQRARLKRCMLGGMQRMTMMLRWEEESRRDGRTDGLWPCSDLYIYPLGDAHKSSKEMAEARARIPSSAHFPPSNREQTICRHGPHLRPLENPDHHAITYAAIINNKSSHTRASPKIRAGSASVLLGQADISLSEK